MKLYRILDLVGEPVKGKAADIRSRHADGSLMYPEQHNDPDESIYMVTMESVAVKKEGGHKWLRWDWSGGERFNTFCHFSGIRTDSDSVADYHIMMEAL